MALAGLPVNRVFIGSCTNARLPDLQAAADVVRGRHVADGVVAMVVPGSSTVKREAEAKGLDQVFRDAGFFWGESGCSMCAGGNGDRGEPGERIVSTTNRNFENRQGPKVRTHLAAPRPRPQRDRRPHRRRAQHFAGARLMQPFSSHTGIAVPLLKDDINTDQVAPVQAMRDAQARLQEAAVHARAQRDDGSEDPDFVLNQPQFRNPGILVTGHNFGAGSSREAAVWGMLANNIRVIVARELRRHLSRELPAERPAAGRARAADADGFERARDRGQRRGAVHGRSRDADASAARAGRTSRSTSRPPTACGCWKGSTTSG